MNPMTDTTPGAIFKGLKPPKIRALLADLDTPLTLEDVDVAFVCAYPDSEGEADPKNVNHTKTFAAIDARRTAVLATQAESGQRERLDTIHRATTYLKGQGFDATLLSDDDLFTIGTEMATWTADPLTDGYDTVKEPGELHIVLDDDTGVWTTEGGVLVGFREEGTLEIEAVLRLAGERMTRAQAKLAAEEAEKKAWIDKINATYDAKVNRLRRHADWIKAIYPPVAKGYIERYNARAQEADDEAARLGRHRKPTTVRSLKLGLLTIQLRETVKRVDVENDAKVIAALRASYADPEGPFYGDDAAKERIEAFIAKKETIAKSAFTDEDRQDPVLAAIEGLTFVPGGTDTCAIK